jgi:hypothetical protein
MIITQISAIFHKIPPDALHYILSYDEKIKYRHGMYINQINKNDPRYKILLTIPKYMTQLTAHKSALNKFRCQVIFSNWRFCLYVYDSEANYDGSIPSCIRYMFVDKQKQRQSGFYDNYNMYCRQ